MKRIAALLMGLALLLPSAAIAQEAEVIDPGTVWVVVLVYDGLGWVPVADGRVPPTYISCQP